MNFWHFLFDRKVLLINHEVGACYTLCLFPYHIHSLRSLSYDKSIATSKASFQLIEI